MELIERYLQAVKFWLPNQQKDDIIAELSEDIHAQIEEQETTLGRKLNGAELKAFLKKRGQPLLVANRYLPQRYLIGPTLFPIYWFVLRIALICYFAPLLLLTVFVDRDIHFSFLASVINPLVIVTLLFAAFERWPPKFLSEDWDPDHLPIVHAKNQIPRSGSLIELVVNLLFASWWIANMYAPQIVHLSPLWPWFFWSFLALALANATAAIANLREPYWTTLKAAIRLFTDCAGGALFCWLLKVNILVGISASSLTAAQAISLTKTINTVVAQCLGPTILVSLLIASFDVYRLLRLRPKPPMTPLANASTHASYTS